MATFTMYRCDVCGLTSDQKDQFQRVSFPTGTVYTHCPEWLICDLGDCFTAIWARRHEVSEVKTYGDLLTLHWPRLGSIFGSPVMDEDDEEDEEDE